MVTLTERDKTVLRRLIDDPATVERLVGTAEYDRSELTERLSAMEENGLVRRGDDGAYALTESGRRVLEAPASGAADNRIDVPEHVQAAIDALDLRADREEAVYNAFAFLRYWGEATESEIVDGIYSENPVEYESVDGWWQTFMRDALASLPDVKRPGADERTWRYVETPEVETEVADGRQLFAPDTDSFGSVKHALEALDLPDEQRAAVHEVFATLLRRETATEADLKSEVYERADAGYASADEWWENGIEPVLRELPGIERAEDRTWRYAGTDSSQFRPGAQSAESAPKDPSDDTDTAGETDADDVCPVCQQPYSGSVSIEAGETRLSGWSIPTCVKATPADTPAGTELTLYYHDEDGADQ